MPVAVLSSAASMSLSHAPTNPAQSPGSFRVAPLDLDDTPKLQRFLMRLDRDARHHRFGHEVCDDVIRAHAVKVLTDASWVFGAFAGGDLRGVIELNIRAQRMFEAAAWSLLWSFSCRVCCRLLPLIYKHFQMMAAAPRDTLATQQWARAESGPPKLRPHRQERFLRNPVLDSLGFQVWPSQPRRAFSAP